MPFRPIRDLAAVRNISNHLKCFCLLLSSPLRLGMCLQDIVTSTRRKVKTTQNHHVLYLLSVFFVNRSAMVLTFGVTTTNFRPELNFVIIVKTNVKESWKWICWFGSAKVSCPTPFHLKTYISLIYKEKDTGNSKLKNFRPSVFVWFQRLLQLWIIDWITTVINILLAEPLPLSLHWI